MLFLLAGLSACESADHTAERLRNDMVFSCAVARGSADASRQNACDVATRKYNQFMSGR